MKENMLPPMVINIAALLLMPLLLVAMLLLLHSVVVAAVLRGPSCLGSPASLLAASLLLVWRCSFCT